MNNIKKNIIIMILTAGLFSCSESLLDIPQQGVLPSETYYTTADDATVTSFISAVYYEIRGNVSSKGAMAIGGSNSVLYLRSILEKMGGDVSDYYEFIETASGSSYSYVWSYNYTIIYWCNMIIDKLPGNNVASEKLKNHVIAEARAIRAIMMMNLVQLYGNPPLADHLMDGTELNTPAETSWAFINTELAEAAEGLPSKAGLGGQSAIGGRITREAAYAYLGKAYLWQKKYDEAAKTLHDKVIVSGLYELNTDFNELNRYTSDFCDEYLWEFDVTNEGDYSLSQAGYMEPAYFTWPNIYRPDEIFNDQGWGNNACSSESFGSFMDLHDVMNGKKSSRYIGTVATYEDLLDLYTYNNTGNKGVQNPVEFCEGYFRVRLMTRIENLMGGANWYNKYTHNNVCYMRYAEVLLNYAEAVAMGGSNGSSLSGLQALNIVRSRTGLTNAPSLDMNNATYGIKAERRAELHWEGTRFIDLVRWGDASTTLADMGKKKHVFYGYNNNQNTISQSKSEWKIVESVLLGEGFKANKNELFPIPTVEMNSNPSLIQNPGW